MYFVKQKQGTSLTIGQLSLKIPYLIQQLSFKAKVASKFFFGIIFCILDSKPVIV